MDPDGESYEATIMWTSTGWVPALAEPTPFGEIIYVGGIAVLGVGETFILIGDKIPGIIDGVKNYIHGGSSNTPDKDPRSLWEKIKDVFRWNKGASNNAYDIAKSGGKHSGFYKQYLNKSTSEINKGVRSLQKQISLHQDKIKNPQKYINDFYNLDSRQQEALLTKKWPGDIMRQMEQLEILKGILSSK